MVERRASGPLRRQRVEANISGEKRCDSRAEQGEGKSDAIAMMNRRRETAGDVDTHVRFDGAGARREEHRRVVLIVALDDQQRGERGGRDASAAVVGLTAPTAFCGRDDDVAWSRSDPFCCDGHHR